MGILCEQGFTLIVEYSKLQSSNPDLTEDLVHKKNCVLSAETTFQWWPLVGEEMQSELETSMKQI